MKSIVVDTIEELKARPRPPFVEAKHKPGNNGFGLCPHCGRGVHEVTDTGRNSVFSDLVPYLRHNPIARVKAIPDRERTHCSKCGKPGAWYEFKPGSGECTECQP